MNPFVSTRALRAGHFGAMTFSVAAHTALIVMAAAPSETSPWHAREVVGRGYPTERVHFVAVAVRARAHELDKVSTNRTTTKKAAHGQRTSTAAGARLTFRPLAVAPIALPDAAPPPLAEIDLSSMISDSLDFSDAGLADVIGTVLGTKHAQPIDGVYTAESVEKVVNGLRGNPKPEYPPSLAAAYVEGTLQVRFVVDSTGRVRDKSVEFPRRAHPLFVDAVRRALLRSRYLPAEVDGRRVPQLVSQEFVFRMGR
jgi:TonB family protein